MFFDVAYLSPAILLLMINKSAYIQLNEGTIKESLLEEGIREENEEEDEERKFEIRMIMYRKLVNGII